MLNKLIENWLDSASERSYQPIFCQVLQSQGYKVIHSSRHCAAEHGKDIIAIDPNGNYCAFQLKGNPKGRVTLEKYRNELLPQLDALTQQRILHPSVPKDANHKSYFVTNGYIEEEAQQAIALKNEQNDQDKISHRNLNIITRDQLLAWCIELENNLWPNELSDTKNLLEIITHDGSDLFPTEKIHSLMNDLLLLKKDDKKIGTNDFKRRVSSAALLTEICLTSFNKKNNYWAIISAWTIFANYLTAASIKHGFKTKTVKSFLISAEMVIEENLINLLDEVTKTDHPLIEGDALTDYIAYTWRSGLITSILSAFWLSLNIKEGDQSELLDKINQYLSKDDIIIDLWGEAALPGAMYYAWQRVIANDLNKGKEISLKIYKACLSPSLPAVYHSIEDVIQTNLSETLEGFSPTILTKKDVKDQSWFIRQAYLNLVQLDMFDECEETWKAYQSIAANVFYPNSTWGYFLLHCQEGTNMSYHSPDGMTWAQLQDLTKLPLTNPPLDLLLQFPLICLIWTIISPQRAIPELTCNLFSKFCLPPQIASQQQDKTEQEELIA